MEKIRVGVVNYLNTKPMLYGLERLPVREQLELLPAYPSNVARQLLNGTIDIGLVPVASIPSLKESHIVSDYCIGTEGEIATVALFSEVPIEEVERVYLDYQSRTSVELCKYLLREFWHISPQLINATGEEYRDAITGRSAGLVIGDRAFQQRKQSPYIYDLGSAWHSHTGLPFVFAAWVSNRPLDPSFLRDFNAAVGEGLSHIDEIVSGLNYPFFDLAKYYKVHLSYLLDERKREAMRLFLEKIAPTGSV